MTPSLIRAGAVAGLAAALAAAPASALAATHHPHPVKTRHASHKPVKPAKHAKVTIHGLVVSRQGDQLTVLADTVKVGQRAVHNKVEHLTLGTPRARRSAANPHAARVVQAGYVINASGEVGANGIDDVTVQSSNPRPAQVVFGTVDLVSGTVVTVCGHDAADGEGSGSLDGSRGASSDARMTAEDAGGSGCQGDALLADLSDAAFTGAAAGPADLTPGEYLLVLGERLSHMFVAAQVVAYAAQPAFVVGQVTAADQASTTMTVAAEDGEEGGPAGTPVDTSAATISVNGAQDGTYPAVGDKAFVVGPDGSAATMQPGSTLSASFVFDFNSGDDHPADNGED